MRPMMFIEECGLMKAWYSPVEDNAAMNARLGELKWDGKEETLKDIVAQIMHAYVSSYLQWPSEPFG